MDDFSRRLAQLSPEKRKLLERQLTKNLASPIHPQIPRLARDTDHIPLSFAQQRLWFLDQLNPGMPTYNISFAMRLTGPLRIGALWGGLNAIMRRHEALRTTFPAEGGQPLQHVTAPRSLPLSLIELSGLPADQREWAARRLARREARRSFDLARGPLFRARLLRLDAAQHVLLLTLHHIVFDGWSSGIFFQELTALYTAALAGQAVELPGLPIQYADYAVWQRAWLRGAVLDEQIGYWREHLAGAPAVLELPTDRPRPPIQTINGAAYPFVLPAALGAQIKLLSREQGATLFMTLLAAWQVLLARYTGQSDIVIGSPVAGRSRTELEGLIGLFINTLALHTNLSGNPSFQEALGRVREVCVGAFAHQDLPFEKLVEELRLERNLSHTLLFQVMFDLHNTPPNPVTLPGLAIEWWEEDSGLGKFDLLLAMRDGPRGFAGALEYNTDLFDETTIARMAEHFATLLDSIVRNPACRIGDLTLLSETEQHELIVTRNATQTRYPDTQCFHHLFEAQVSRTPDAIAVVFDAPGARGQGSVVRSQPAETLRPPAGGGTEGGRASASAALSPQSHALSASEGSVLSPQSLTYRELNTRANRLAHHLRRLGVGPEVRVAICMDRSLEMLIGLLGIFKAGGAFVPLDPAFPRERMAFILADSGAGVLLTQAHLCARLPDRHPSAGHPLLLCLDADWATIAVAPAACPHSAVTAANLAYLIYTSGSTGRPKGVLIPHRGLINYLAWCVEAYGAAHGRGAPVHASIAADAIFPSLFAPLLAGTCVSILPEDHALEALNDALRNRGRFSLVKITPSQLEVLTQQLPQTDARAWVRTLVIGAEEVLGEVLRFWQANAPDTILLNEYGPTETVVGCSIYHIPPGRVIEGSVPIGVPIANTQFYVLDAHMQPVPIGVPGELYIGGDGVAWGYHNRPDLTAERFVPNPFAQGMGDGCWVTGAESSNTQHPTPNTRLYRTGDLVRLLPDRAGNIVFLGRIDDQVKIRGYRVEPGEIAAVLLHHPAVREAVVLARSDGPGDTRLVAYIVQGSGVRGQGSEGAVLDGLIPDPRSLTPNLRAFLQERLPAYMIPAAFVLLDALPLAPHGKLDRRAFPDPDSSRPALGVAFVSPRTPAEETMASIWAAVLRLETIGIHDNFFELGGHSLLATQVISRIRDAFQVDLPLRLIFEASTVAELTEAAAQLRGKHRADHIARVSQSAEERMLSQLDQLMDEEVDSLLVELLAGEESPQ